MKKVIAGLIMSCISTSALAEHKWFKAGEGINGSIHYVSWNDIKIVNKDTVIAYLYTDASKDKTTNIHEAWAVVKFNCSERTMQQLAYKEADIKNNISSTGTTRKFYVLPDSIGEMKLDFVCGLLK